MAGVSYFITCRSSFCVTGAILQKMSFFCGRRSAWRPPSSFYLAGAAWCVFMRIPVSGLRPVVPSANVQIPWQAWDIMRESFCMAGAVFGEDPLCVECHLRGRRNIWDTLDSTLYTSHSPFYTLHFALYTPHSVLYTLHFSLYTSQFKCRHSTHYTLHSPLYT